MKSLTVIVRQLNKKNVKYHSENEQLSWNILQELKVGPFYSFKTVGSHIERHILVSPFSGVGVFKFIKKSLYALGILKKNIKHGQV